MDEAEIRKSATLEKRHWWYAGRRALLRRMLKDLPPGTGLDVGAGSGGNAAVLRDLGWQMVTLDRSPAAAEMSRARGLSAARGDGTRLPFPDGSFDLVISTDAWEHVEDDEGLAAETRRVLRPGGTALIAVPAGMDLWSGHDVALGHVRRYEKEQLVALLERHGLLPVRVQSWNVLLRPVAKARRRSNTGESEMEHVNPVLNAALRTIIAIESALPVSNRRGISIVVRAVRP